MTFRRHSARSWAIQGSRNAFSRLWGIVSLSATFYLFCAGCASWYAADADREVHTVLAQYSQKALGNREQQILRPRELPEAPTSAPSSAPSSAEDGIPGDEDLATTQPSAETQPVAETQPANPELIDLTRALHLAFTSSRDYLDQQESLYLSGLGFTLTRYNFGPILDSTISYLWQDRVNSVGSDSLSAGVSARQIMPLGGTATLSGDVTGSRDNGPDLFRPPDPSEYDYNSNVQLNLRQPLLRGFGYEVSHEALTQGERDLVYAVRAYELFRQDFCINVTEAYYQLVSQKMQLANDEQNYRDAVFDREKSEALRQVDRNRDDDVFLAKRREIEAEDALLVARTNYTLAVDDFKILLGLSTSATIEVPDEEPTFKSVRIEPKSAVEVALHNRLDLHTVRDRVDDAERQVRLAKNGLLPDLDLNVDWGFNNLPSKPFDPTPERWSATVGTTLDLPLDRKAERNAYRASLIALAQIRRDLEQRENKIERDVLDQLRQLTQVEKRIQLQRDQIEREKRAVTVTRIRIESGDAQTRDLLDAQQGLTNARNALLNLQVQHFIGRLRLNRNLGVLFIDNEGRWRE